MSGEMAARALHDHFDNIRRTELSRLRKKVSALTDAERAEVDAITAEIIDALARQPVRALERDGSPLLVQAIVELFHVGASR
jgi:glutamyl-tRNA reductase